MHLPTRGWFPFWIPFLPWFLLGVASLPAVTERIPAGDLTPLTDGPGNDTEAVWSPDGKQIVFQSDRNGSLDLFLLHVETRTVKPLVEGPGHAAFPAWSPDGKWIIYSFASFPNTAFEGWENGYNLFLVTAEGGSPRRLTKGRYRDYSPAFLGDGRTIWFSSSRGAVEKSNAVSLHAISTDGGEPKLVLRREGVDRASVQASVSPDGRSFVCGTIAGFQDNWRIRLAHRAFPGDGYLLTGSQGSFYGPRWSPQGTLLACSGFEPGDAHWGAWLIDVRTGHRGRMDTGPGNTRSPAWSPDGRRLVVENNRTGNYKLYSVPVPAWPAAPAPVPAGESPAAEAGMVLSYSFAGRPGPVIADRSVKKNGGQVLGVPAWRDGAVSFAPAGASLTIPEAQGFDFGTGAFAVHAVVQAPETRKLAIIAMGEYPGNRLGWQLYVGEDGRAWFNSRTVDLIYRGARSDEPLPTHRAVTLVGQRDAAGNVRLYVDGTLQQATSAEACYAYGHPVQVRIGTRYDGGAAFEGWIHEVTVHARERTPEEISAGALARFWAARPE